MFEHAPRKWILLAGNMNGGGCCLLTPEREEVDVQGFFALDKTNRELMASGKEKVPEGESVMRIPKELLLQVAAVMQFIESRPASELRWVVVGHRESNEIWQLAPDLQAEALRGV